MTSVSLYRSCWYMYVRVRSLDADYTSNIEPHTTITRDSANVHYSTDHPSYTYFWWWRGVVVASLV